MSAEPLSPELEHCLDLLCAAVAEPDEGRSAELIEESGRAFVGSIRESWGKRLELASSLLAEAEKALDTAEATNDPDERGRQMQRFEELMSAAEASQKARPGLRMH